MKDIVDILFVLFHIYFQSENVFYNISVSWYLLRFILCPSTCTSLMNIPYVLAYYAMQCSVNFNLVKIADIILFFSDCFFYLLCPYWFYWILILSISKRGLLIYTTIIVDLSHSPFTFVNFTSWILMLLFVANIFRIILPSWRFTFFISCNAIFLVFALC